MRVYFGADHAGYQFKDQLKDYVESLGYDAIDLGTFNEDSVDYPDIAREVAEKVYENGGALGVLLCGSGTGMCMSANKHKGIRAAAVTSDYLAEFARKHNNANIIAMGSRVVELEAAKSMLKIFLETPFEGGRHERRVEKMMELED